MVPEGYLNVSTNVGSIYMIPIGGVSLQVEITHNSTPLPSWGLGLWIATVCSLNGLTAGIPTINPATYTVNVTTTSCLGGCGGISPGFTNLPAIPLRNYVTVAPDTIGACGPVPMWPIPGDFPVW